MLHLALDQSCAADAARHLGEDFFTSGRLIPIGFYRFRSVDATFIVDMDRRTVDKLRAALRRRVSANLRRHRARLDLTQERMAERSGFALQYYQRIERKLVNVPLDTLARLAKALEVDPRELLKPNDD